MVILLSEWYYFCMDSGIFFYSDTSRRSMHTLVENLPSDMDVFLVGGAVRNALVKKYHGETWVQRDYDQVITKNSAQYFNYLKQNGFIFRGIDDPNHKTASKPVVDNAREISYEDNLVFDMHIADGTTIEDEVRFNSMLLLNGFALSLRDSLSSDIESKIIALPGALDSIKNREIRLNPDNSDNESNYFFAVLRFMGMGFSAPPHNDVRKLLKRVEGLPTDRYERNVAKVVGYVGGEEKLKEIVDSLGIENLNIFDQGVTKNIAQSL